MLLGTTLLFLISKLESIAKRLGGRYEIFGFEAFTATTWFFRG
jgi:hypothetical protein